MSRPAGIAKPIQGFIKSAFLRSGVYLSRISSSERLSQFFSKVYPVQTNKHLVRLGGYSDGGYLVPCDIEGCVGCFSPGVSTIADFELALAERQVPSFLADYSIERPPVQHNLFDFEKKYLGSVNDDVFMTLQNWMDRKAPEGDLILQMDIEGAEYEVLCQTSQEYLRRFRIIIIEFHELHALLEPTFLRFVSMIFDKLLANFDIVHIHPNNRCGIEVYRDVVIPVVMEFTFLRKDRVDSRKFSVDFPHELDRKNVPEFADITLPKCWHR